MSTLETIVSNVVTTLRLQAGIGVNTYTEDRVSRIVLDLFDHLFRKRFWDDFMTDMTYTIDTSTGFVTGANVDDTYNRFSDIQFIWRDTDPDPLPRPPAGLNPARIRRPCYVPYAADLNKMFKLLPIDQTTTVTVRGRVHPGEYGPTDEVKMDNLLLKHGACYQYAVEMGTNKEAMDLYQRQFNDYLNERYADENYSVVRPNLDHPNSVTDWY